MKLPHLILLSVCFVGFTVFLLYVSDASFYSANLFARKPAFLLEEALESVFSESESLETPEPKTVTLVFGGDVMLSRYVDMQMRKHKSYTKPFEDIAEYLSSADIAFINLESPFHPNPKHFSSGMMFGADILAMEGLIFAGIDIVSLANNHFGDSGKNGMLFTMEELHKNDIHYTGAGKEKESANTATYITANDTTFAFLAYSSISPYYQATETAPGFAVMPDIETLQAHIKTAKEFSDVVIVSVHTGNEYVRYPKESFVDFARSAIDGGATLVIGHHPHVVQPVEWYNGGLIAYSLGNLIFDQYFDGTKEGILLQTVFENTTLKEVEIRAIILEDLFRARFANEEESIKVLKRTEWEKS